VQAHRQSGDRFQVGVPRQCFLFAAVVFYRSDAILDDLSQLKEAHQHRPEGSGVRKFSVDLLKPRCFRPATELHEFSMGDAGKAIRESRLDAVMAFGSADSAIVQELINAPDIKLMSFSQAEAYTRLFPNLST